jgi:hypothetical protein
MSIVRGPSILVAALALQSIGCSLVVDAFEKTPEENAQIDAGETADCSDWPSLAADFDLCDQEPVTLDLVVDNGNWNLNTDSGELTDGEDNPVVINSRFVMMPNGIEAQVIMVSSLRMEDNINAKGSRPLVIASWGDIEVNGSLQVEGSNSEPGAGANPADCGDSAGQAGLDDLGGASGGGGGAFGGPGGAGGTGDSDTSAGGAPGIVSTGTGLRGGCPGGVGGNTGGPGGSGGGAVALIAISNILITGDIEAVGRGGEGGKNDRSGGSGGGSGGMILLTSDQIEIQASARLSANGGSGGGGAAEIDDGESGRKGRLDLDAAQGGTGATFAGAGGLGSSFADPAGGAGLGDFAGGGGGGGGAGIIDFVSEGLTIDSAAIVTPAAL